MAKTVAIRVGAEALDLLPRQYAPAKLAHVVIKTPRPDKILNWYATVLDGIVVFRDKQVGFMTYDEEHHRVAVIGVPGVFRVPLLLGRYHRKFLGIDHTAFTYESLEALVVNYRRLADLGIRPVWCINHGPTTSMYYEDPDGNRIELQHDNFTTNDELIAWMDGGDFDKNPIGVEFDPDVLERKMKAGVPTNELVERGSAPPDGRKAREGMKNIRWKTL